MNKQDRHGARTPEDVVRRFKDIPQGVEAAQKAASNAYRAAEEANKAAENANKAAALAVRRDEFDAVVEMLNQATATITRLVVQSGGFSLDAEGNMIVPRIVLNGFDLDKRLLAIEKKLNESGGTGGDDSGGGDSGGDDGGDDGGDEPTISYINGGTKTVGDMWVLISGDYVGTYHITSTTGGLQIVVTSDAERLKATAEGEATATVTSTDGKVINVWTFAIVAEDSGDDGGDDSGDDGGDVGNTCNHENELTYIITVPTCSEKGLNKVRCADCDTWLRDVVVDERDHENTRTQTITEPTCTETGLKHVYCSDCGELLNAEEIPMLGHDWVKGATIAPTCTEYGYTKYTCRRCRETTEDDSVEPNGHSWGVPYYDSIFSTGYGYTCTVCGENQSRTPPAHVHSYTYSKTVAATCETGGYEVWVCTCGATEHRNETEPNGHFWGVGGGWVTDVEATCEKGGTEKHTCVNCGKVETRATNPLGHDWGSPYYSSEFSSGYGHKCQRSGCGELEELAYVECEHPASAYSETVIVEPTCTVKGSKTCTCDVCRQSWSEEIAALGHDWGSPEYDDSFSSGQSHTCERCGEVEEYS